MLSPLSCINKLHFIISLPLAVTSKPIRVTSFLNSASRHNFLHLTNPRIRYASCKNSSSHGADPQKWEGVVGPFHASSALSCEARLPWAAPVASRAHAALRRHSLTSRFCVFRAELKPKGTRRDVCADAP